jgi:hypothetical protein
VANKGTRKCPTSLETRKIKLKQDLSMIKNEITFSTHSVVKLDDVGQNQVLEGVYIHRQSSTLLRGP